LFTLVPQTPTTYHIISTEFLKMMKPTAILVNAGRGGLVDSDALAKALREGQLFAAGLDVVEGEPHITKNHSLLQEPR
jgi:glyoxylate/hydroxypyruvate reductase